jgi:amino acid adenylation domain-containing protein
MIEKELDKYPDNTAINIENNQTSNYSKVSVVIPAYNSAKFLPEAIESVLGQTYPVFEIVVVDDGSTDETKAVCDQYPTVKYIYQANQGVAEARNTGMRMSSGEYLIFLDSDDRLLPQAAEIGINCIKDRPEVGFVFGGYMFQTMNSNGSYITEEIYDNQLEVASYATILAARHKIQCGCIVFRRVAIESIGEFDQTLAPAEDVNLFLRIAREFPIYFHGQIVSEYRYNGNNLSSKAAKMLIIALRSHRRQWSYIQQAVNKEYEIAYECGRQYWTKLFLDRLPYEIVKNVRAGKSIAALGMLRLILSYDPKLKLIDREIYEVADRALRSALRKLPIASSLAYWQQQLAGAPPLLPLPADQSRGTEQTFRGSTQSFVLSDDLTSALRLLSNEKGVTLFMTVLAALDTLLYRYTGTEDLIVGAPMVDRDDDGEIFVNAVALRTDLAGNPSFEQLLNRVRKVVLAGEVHQDVPFEILVEELQLQQDSSYSPLFQVMLAFEGDVSFQKIELSSLTASPWVLENNEGKKFDLTLLLEQNSNELRGKWVYNTDLFDASTIDRLNEHFQILLASIVANPACPISELPLLTEAERHQLLVEWNQTQVEYSQNKCIHHWFEEQVERTPDGIAVVYENQQLTYRELNNRANQLANYLITLGVRADALVGICIERSIDTIVGILGILKAGGAYVPLDPSNPQDRLEYILKNAQVQILVTHSTLLNILPECDRVVCLDTEDRAIAEYPETNPVVNVNSHNLAYIIYTSGSTGKPKGVLVNHDNVVRLFTATESWYHFNEKDVWTLFHSFAFDFSVWEIWGALCYGGRIVVVPYLVSRDTEAFYNLLIAEHVTVLNQTPSAFYQLIEADENSKLREKLNLRLVIFGGEALNLSNLKPWFDRHGDQLPQLVNMYGITETTVHVTYRPLTLADVRATGSLIGRPIPDLQIYLLDRHRQPVPIGVHGEMYVGGAGVAQGYWQRDKLTAERFISNPFSKDPNARLYKSGDLARYLKDGGLEYIGRIDNQVKIRGFRIELGEIEALLSQHPDLDRSVVVVNEDIPGDKRLVAYFVSHQERKPTIDDLRDFLSQKLPSYMIPAAFVALDLMPLTSNGKVDYRALPAPDRNSLAIERRALATAEERNSLAVGSTNTLEIEDSFVTPRTPTEEILVDIWSQVLGVDLLSIYDNFFLLGGHSLLAIQMISRCRKTFSIELPLRQLFESPTVADLAIVIDKSQHQESELSEYQTIPQRANRANAPLSFAQQRLWFLNQLEPNSPFYNFSWAVRLQGDLNLEILQQSLDAIVVHQEILRTKYITDNGNPIQVIAPPQSVELSLVDLQQYERVERETQAQKILHQESQRPINLASEIIFRGCLLQIAPQEHVLLLVMHHIASDGWSMGVFWEQLTQLYTAFLNGRPNPLATLPIQYADYAVWQRQWLTGEVLNNQLNYWKQQLAGANPLLELPTDRPRPPVQTYRGASQSIVLPATLTTALKKLCAQEGVTLYMTLLAAFQTLLYRYSGQEDILVGSPIAGRNRAEIERLIGFFVNTLVLRTDLSGNPSFQELLTRVRSTTLDAYAHQDLPFEKLVEELNPERSLSYSPLFQVMFVLQNTLEQTVELPGLTQTPMEIGTATAQFDLTLSVAEKDGLLIGLWNYNTDLFDAQTIARMNEHLQILLEGIVANPEQPICQLPILTGPERHQLLVEWNQTQTDYPQDKCLHQLFEAQVERTPDAVAVVFEGQQLTYRELNNQANQLAHYLRSRGVRSGVLVGLYLERSLAMVVGLWGILKAGGAYVPLDPAYPKDRVAYILVDAEAKVLIADPHLLASLPTHQAEVVSFDADRKEIERQQQSNPVTDTQPDNLAYVIYTSGSTGNPKGVEVCHSSQANLLNHLQHSPGLTSADTLLAVTTICFDTSTADMFLPLVVGAKIVLVSSEVAADGFQLLAKLTDSGATFMQATPVSFRLLLAAGWQGSPDLRVVSTGEALPRNLADLLLDKVAELWDLYGPTETTVWSTVSKINELRQISDYQGALELIGRPIANTQAYILDGYLQPVPIGICGELHIGGDCLAKGYFHRPDLTIEKFIANPFSNDPNSRLYKTGDLARYLPDGNIEYISRIDNQVKIRGFRIELGEIEALLAQHAGIRELAVIAREDIHGDKRLVAYVVPQQERPQIGELRSFLQEHLPNYMVPNFFVFLDTLPLTPNGKIDRRALPAPDLSNQESAEIFVAAQDDLERELTEIWERVLGVEAIGIRDNFFDLGGHSLMAVSLFSQIEQTFGKNLPLATLFKAPTIEQLASFLRQEKPPQELWGSLVPLQTDGSKPPLFCIHGGGFNVLIYRQLAQYLGSDRPVYALQARGLDGDFGSILDRIEDMATDYIQEIKTVQPQGPYLLAGLSNGGNIALEMAQQLQAQGQTVAIVAMFDSYGPEGAKLLPPFPRFLSSLLYALQYSVPRLLSRSQHSGQNVIATKLNHAIKQLFLSTDISKATLPNLDRDSGKNLEHKNTSSSRENPLEQMMNRVSSYVLEHSPWAFYSPSAQLNGSNDPVASTLKKLEQSYHKAYKAYTPQPYQGRIVVFQAMESPPGYQIAPKLGWEKIARNEVEVHKIPGNHTSIMESPILAQKMRACLEIATDNNCSR